MIFKLWEAIFEYFKAKPYWSRIQPLFSLFSLYLITEVLAYQFIQWQYRISPSLSLYFSSYIFKQITLVFVAIGIIGFFFSREAKRKDGGEQDKLEKFVRKYGRILVQKVAIVGFVLLAVVPLFLYFTPNKVSHIRIKFLREPDFDKYAFVYLIYELNKLQKNWYFEVDFDVFDENVLTSRERESCTGEYKSLCYAETIAKDHAFIGITNACLSNELSLRSPSRTRWRSVFVASDRMRRQKQRFFEASS